MNSIKILLLSVFLTLTLLVRAQGNLPYSAEKDSAQYHFERQQYSQSLAWFKKSFEKGNDIIHDYYNAACAAALAGQKDEGFTLLRKAIDMGYLDKPWTMKDPDFATLRGDERWPAVLQKFEENKKIIEAKFAVIKAKDPSQLIPYYKNGWWGYLDKKTRKVVVKPEFRNLGFMNGCTRVTYKDDCDFMLNAQGVIITIMYPEHDDDAFNIEMDDSDRRPPYAVNISKGFSLDGHRKIFEFSNTYNRYEPKSFNIQGPFVIDGKYYAVAHKEKASGVINETGDALPGFDFVHKELIWNSRTKGDAIWFQYVDNDGKKGFINHKGEVRLAGELLSYPFTSNDRFGYNIQYNETKSGVLDTENATWLIKPQDKKKFIEINATTSAECLKYTDDRNELIELYFLVQDGNEKYYVDKKMKEYRVK